MPCRAKIGRRASALIPQPDAAIWITDDVLNNAWDRFARTCLRHQSQRCTSNHSGPLEARRRSAKRRIGSAGTLSDGMGGAFDLGQLFGLRSAVPQYEKEWRWEAPSSSPAAAPRNRWENSRLAQSWLMPKPPKSQWEQSLEVPKKALEEMRTESRSTFEQLLLTLASLGTVEESDMAPLLNFLQGPQDEPTAKNTTLLLDWLLEQSITPSAHSQIVQMVTDKFKLDTLSYDEFEHAVEALLRLAPAEEDKQQALLSLWSEFIAKQPTRLRNNKPGNEKQTPNGFATTAYETLVDATVGIDGDLGPHAILLPRILQMLSAAGARLYKNRSMALVAGYVERMHSKSETKKEEMATVIGDALPLLPHSAGATVSRRVLNMMLAGISEHQKFAVSSEHLSKTLFWLHCLRKSNLTRDKPASDPIWREVYAKLAGHFTPIDLSEHFSQVTSENLAQALLRWWLPSIASAKRDAPVTLDHITLTRLLPAVEGTLTSDDLKRPGEGFEQQWQAYQTSKRQPPEEHHKFRSFRPFVAACQQAAKLNIPYDGLLATIISIIKQSPDPARAGQLLLQISRTKNLGVPQTLASDLIHHYLDLNNLPLALRLFQALPSLPLTPFLSLPLALAHSNPPVSTPDTIFRLLERRSPMDTLAPEFRSPARLIYSTSHINTVHDLATAFAANPSHNTRTAFRRVWECYRWLRDRLAPLDSRLSRAMVQAGLTRPLSERHWVGTVKARYILGIVRELEGDEVAGDLDRLVYHLRARMAAEAGETGVQTPERGEGDELWRAEVSWKARLWVREERRKPVWLARVKRRRLQRQGERREVGAGYVPALMGEEDGGSVLEASECSGLEQLEEISEEEVRPQGVARRVLHESLDSTSP
ncbi:hypothetical protein MBLNU230_g3642t1 [Neophaeotheca triangularis]